MVLLFLRAVSLSLSLYGLLRPNEAAADVKLHRD